MSNSVFRHLRENAISNAMNHGVRLSHLPDYKFNMETRLDPESKVSLDGRLEIDKIVLVEPHLLIPWQTTLAIYQVDALTENRLPNSLYRHKVGGSESWEAHYFQILCFVDVILHKKQKAQKTSVQGEFCILSYFGSQKAECDLTFPIRSHIGEFPEVNSKVLLHWTGCLAHPKTPVKDNK